MRKTQNSQAGTFKIQVKSGSGRYLDGVAFGLSKFAGEMESGKSFDVAYTLEMNTFRGERTLQMMVKDIKLGA